MTLGDLGDFLGGIGVIVTLVYLALQIRRNTQSVHSAALDSVSTFHSALLDHVAQDPELTKLWFDGLSGESELSESDSRRFMLLLISAARRWESAFHTGRSGTLESSEWAGMLEELTIVFSSPGTRNYWPLIRSMFSPEFADFAERAIRLRSQSRQPAAQHP